MRQRQRWFNPFLDSSYPILSIQNYLRGPFWACFVSSLPPSVQIETSSSLATWTLDTLATASSTIRGPLWFCNWFAEDNFSTVDWRTGQIRQWKTRECRIFLRAIRSRTSQVCSSFAWDCFWSSVIDSLMNRVFSEWKTGMLEKFRQRELCLLCTSFDSKKPPDH
jgi:hypothetical protein